MKIIPNNQPGSNPFLLPLKAWVLVLYSIQLVVLLTSLFKIKLSSPLALGIIFLSAFACLPAFLRRPKQIAIKGFHPNRSRLAIILILIIAVCALIYLLLMALAIQSPDLSFEGNAYHIPAISMWASKGFVHWIDTPYQSDVLNGYPKGAEVIAYALTMAFGNPMVNTINLIFLPLGILGIASLAWSLGSRRLPALCAGFLYVLIPVNINQSATTHIDSAFASGVIGLIAIWFASLQTVKLNWRLVLPLGASLGLVLGMKITSIPLCGIAFLLWIVNWLLHQKGQGKPFSKWLGFCGFIAGVFIIAAAGGGFWYIRNYLFTGTPLYPAGVHWLGKEIFSGKTVLDAVGRFGVTPIDLLVFPAPVRVMLAWLQGLSRWPSCLLGYDTPNGGMGFLWLLGCVPSLIMVILGMIKKRFPWNYAFINLLILVGAFFIITPMNWWARYTIWIYAAGLPALAWVISAMMDEPQPTSRAGRWRNIWLFLVLVLSMFEGQYCTRHILAITSPGSLSDSPIVFFRKETWIWSSYYLAPEMEGTALEEVLTRGKMVAIGPASSRQLDYFFLVGMLSQPIGKRSILIYPEEFDLDQMLKKKVDYLIWDEGIPLSKQLTGLTYRKAVGFLVFQLTDD